MILQNYKLLRIVFLTPFVLILSSCEGNFKEIQRSKIIEFSPNGVATDFNLKYTDSGKIKSILLSSKMLDYGSLKYPFTEFPNGIDLTLFDNKGKKTFVNAQFAIKYKATNVIELQKNVVISNDLGQKMTTEQLYFDQKNEWFYTEKKFVYTSPEGTITGKGVDFSKDFKIMNTQKMSGNLKTKS